MEDILKAISKKYNGSFATIPDKRMATPYANEVIKTSQATIIIDNQKILINCIDSPHSGTPYKFILPLTIDKSQNFHLYPRKFLGLLIRQGAKDKIHYKYKNNCSRQLLKRFNQDLVVRNLLMNNKMSIYFKTVDGMTKLVILPNQSVLKEKDLEIFIQLGLAISKII